MAKENALVGLYILRTFKFFYILGFSYFLCILNIFFADIPIQTVEQIQLISNDSQKATRVCYKNPKHSSRNPRHKDCSPNAIHLRCRITRGGRPVWWRFL